MLIKIAINVPRDKALPPTHMPILTLLSLLLKIAESRQIFPQIKFYVKEDPDDVSGL